MQCSNCGQINEGRSRHCKSCGQPLKNKKPKRSKKRNIFILLVLLLTIGGASFGVSEMLEGEEQAAETKIEKDQKDSDVEIKEPAETAKDEPEETVPTEGKVTKDESIGKGATVVQPTEQNTVVVEPKKVEKTVIIKEIQQKVFTIMTETSQGSGFLYTDTGMIVTNAHVVAGFTDVMVRNINGQDKPGRVIGISDKYDVALIKVDDFAGIKALPIEMEPTPVGKEVIALGSPSGYENTATMGYITGIDRDFDEGFLYEDIYQIDAKIAPGSSGGPLVDAETGKVIGINSLMSTDGNNFGFSIPMYSMNALLSEWAKNPMSAEQVAAMFHMYDDYEDYTDEDHQYEYDDGTGNTFTENALGEFIANYNHYYELALTNQDFYYIQDFLVVNTPIYQNIDQYISEIEAQGSSFDFLHFDITGVEIMEDHALVHTYEAFNLTDAAGKTTLEERDKTYTVVADESGFYYISDIIIN